MDTAMDEVKAMTHSGETVAGAVGTGLRTLRRGAEQVAAVAEQKLSGGIDMAEFADSGRRARKQLAREAKLTAKELARSAKQARRTARTAMAIPGDLLAAATPKQRRRKWPWLLGAGLGIAAVAAGAAYAMRSRQSPPEDQEQQTPAPQPLHEQQSENRTTAARHG
jgi:hypothetical protein